MINIDITGACIDLLRCFGCDLSLVPSSSSDYFRLACAFIWAVVVFVVLVWSVRKFMTDLFRGLR